MKKEVYNIEYDLKNIGKWKNIDINFEKTSRCRKTIVVKVRTTDIYRGMINIQLRQNPHKKTPARPFQSCGRIVQKSVGELVSRVLYACAWLLSISFDCCQPTLAPRCLLSGRHPISRRPAGVAPDRVYICTQLPVVPVSLYLAFPPVPRKSR